MASGKSMNIQTFHAYKAAQAAGDVKLTKRLRDRLVAENMGLVKRTVGKLHKASGGISEIEDLMQAGAMGLCTAIERLDPEKGKLSTYAVHWIRFEVQKSIDQQMPIKRPRGSGKPWSAAKIEEEIYRKEGRKAEPHELGLIGKRAIRQSDLDKWAAFPLVTSIDTGHVVAASSSPSREISTGVDMTSREGFHDRVADPSLGVDERMILAHTIEDMMAAMSELPDRELRVITALVIEGRGYKEVANTEDVSEEWVRQIRAKAIETLRAAVFPVDEDDDS